MKTIILTSVLALFFFGAHSQSLLFEETVLVNGYSQKISGYDFSYHSSVPVAKECLLIRATDGKSTMEWETATVPSKVEKEFVTFVWLAGLGSSPGRARFDLQVNNEDKFEFWVDGLNEWTREAEDGSTLSFKKDMIDQHGDRFGFMYLKLPAAEVKKGEPLRLKVTGGKFDKTSWYMTFKFGVKDGLTFKSFPAIVETNGVEKQLGVAGVLHFGKPDEAKIYLDNKLIKQTDVNFGYNYVKVDLPKIETSQTFSYKLEVGDNIETGNVTIDPVKKWRVNFVQHAHTDIGYTRSQTEILAEHLRYIDYALDYCDNTDNYPEEAKFRWTCEATWPVDEYLRSRPASQIERLKKRV
ncbi:MAG: hypothetical protein R3182_13320, partial [Draconibacterium sp.]|nr:hypothetical protein [Draconibacterium sp.]